MRITRASQAQVVEAQLQDAVSHLHEKLGGAMCAVQLVAWEAPSGTAVIRISGGCPDCDMTASMFIQGIEAHLRRHVPQVERVRIDPASDTQ